MKKVILVIILAFSLNIVFAESYSHGAHATAIDKPIDAPADKDGFDLGDGGGFWV